jgi:hypothetical protein
MDKVPSWMCSVIVGIILSDCNLQLKPKAVNAYLRFKQSMSHFPYFMFVWNFLAPLCQGIFKFGTCLLNGTVCYFVTFSTRALPFLTERTPQAPHTQHCTNGAMLCVCGASGVHNFFYVTSPAPPHTFEILWISNVCAARGEAAYADFYFCFSPPHSSSDEWGGAKVKTKGAAEADGVKVIPDVLIMYDLLTPIALAHWIKGDGMTIRGVGLYLCTDSFSIIDNVKLINILMVRYQLNCTLTKRNRIYINAASMPRLRSIVFPHIHYSILYWFITNLQ